MRVPVPLNSVCVAASIAAAVIAIAPAAPAVAQEPPTATRKPQALPGLDTVKVKTIPIHRNGGFGKTYATPSAQSASTASPDRSDIPTVKVPTMRIGPNGEIDKRPAGANAK